MENQFTIKYFIKKFEAIPEEKWCRGHFGFGERHCAIGHIDSENAYANPEVAALNIALGGKGHIAEINDGLSGDYASCGDDVSFDYSNLGPTPRQRILNALYAKLRGAASIK